MGDISGHPFRSQDLRMIPDFQHTAYASARTAFRSAYVSAVNALERDCPEADRESYRPAILQAIKLCVMAQRIASEMSQNRDFEVMARELAKRCPGYSHQTYMAAAADAFTDYIR